ncbi:MAG TPA: hypothetical protein VJC18_09545, partial [bacterium]|nr:hypothetical protein [bacterium]
MNGDNKKIFIIVWSLIMWVCLACTQTHSGTTVVSNTVPGTVPAYVVLERVQADWTRVVVPAMAFGFSDSEVLQGSFSIGINDQLVQEQKGTSAYFTSLTETPTINIMVTDVKNGDQITLVIYQLSGRVLTYEGSVSLAQDIRAYLVTDFEEGGAVDLGQGMDLTHEARALTALDDGSLLIAAELRDQPEGAYLTNKFSVRRYTADGELDMTYASGLGVSVVDLDGFFETADDTLSGAQYYFGTSGDLWVLGDVYSQESVGQHYVSVIHVTAEGVPDENFGTDGRITIHPGNLYMGQVVLSMADNSLYFSLNDVDAPNGEMYLARITSEGVWDTSFGTDGLFPLGLTVI